MNKKNYINVLGLAIGVVMGQGSMLFAQAYLVWRGDAEVVASLVMSLGVVTLGMWLVDWGALMYLPQKIKAENVNLLCINIVRLSISIAFYLGFLLIPIDGGGLSAEFLRIASPAVLIWSLNQAGFLDGINKSAVGGVINQLNWAMAAACASIISVSNAHYYAFIGLAFTVGTIITVVTHHVILYRFGYIKNCKSCFVDAGELISFLRFGFYNTASAGLGQVYGRFIQFGINSWIGLDVGGVYSLGRNVLLACCQVVTLVRRVEFVIWAGEKKKFIDDFSVKRLVGFYRQSFVVSLLLLLISSAFLLLMSMMKPSGHWFEVAIIFSVFPSWVFASLLSQIYLFEIQSMKYLFGQVFGVIFSSVIFIATFKSFGITAVAFGEWSMFLFQTYFYSRCIRNV